MLNLTIEEVHALARAVDAAWKSGAIRGPEEAYHLMRAGEELQILWNTMRASQEAQQAGSRDASEVSIGPPGKTLTEAPDAPPEVAS